ncbi:Pol protein [Phytophthora palmivora]|uniref:Pol protein n=1 Tax=Phytophthora palmivora TaxID=4796 RepID=A0A2P4YJ19_9STRA|nr:Pol protein [Phytophthora palmivora]
MSTADHLQTVGQPERVNRMLEDTHRSTCVEHLGPGQTICLWLSARINKIHPVLSEWATPPQMPLTLQGGTNASIVNGGEARKKAFSSQVSNIESESLPRRLPSFIDNRLTLVSRVKDAMASAQDRQKEYSDKNAVSSVGNNKLKHRFIGPFTVLNRNYAAYNIDLPKSMATHPMFYVRCLKWYHDPQDLP